MRRRVLFVIRGKLGDSLVLYSAVRRYLEQFPQDDVTLAIRKDYARLLRGETGLRLLEFGSRLEMVARLAWLRATVAPFDVLAVLWGFGPPIRLFGRLVRAARKIYIDGRFPDVYSEWPQLPRDFTLVEPAMQVIHCFEPGLERPDRLGVASLAARRAAHPAASPTARGPQRAVAIVPVADEVRRNFDPATLDVLLARARALHPDAPLYVYVNPVNRGSEAILAHPLPAGAELRRFARLDQLVEEYCSLAAWHGTDTGLYHLAVSMGIPATVYFGPTQPWKIVMPAQPAALWVRIAALGEAHCEVKTCGAPVCLFRAVSLHAGAAALDAIERTPADCLLRSAAAESLTAIQTSEDPRPQARQAG